MASTLLSLDTSTDLMSVALTTPAGTCLHESAGGALASARLIPELQGLMAQVQRPWSELDAIGFGCGPGAFTGLRTACSVAQGLAFGANKPVIPIDSLLIVAEDARVQLDAMGPLTVWVVMDARMDEIYGACYAWHPDLGHWQTLDAPALYTVQVLQALWQQVPPKVVAGSALTVFAARWVLPEGAQLLPRPQSRAAALGRLAQQQWLRGVAVDAAQALPVYVRNKVAQTTAERMAQQAATRGPAP